MFHFRKFWKFGSDAEPGSSFNLAQRSPGNFPLRHQRTLHPVRRQTSQSTSQSPPRFRGRRGRWQRLCRQPQTLYLSGRPSLT